MSQPIKVNIQEENEFQKIFEQATRHYYLFIIGIVVALGIAFAINQFSTPVYETTSSILLKKKQEQQKIGDYINASLFGTNENLQDELLVLKSSPVLDQTIKNLDLPVGYYRKLGFKYTDAYKDIPFRVMYMRNHVQPIGTRFMITFLKDSSFTITSNKKNVRLYNFEKKAWKGEKKEWTFKHHGKLGHLIETPEISFMIVLDSLNHSLLTYEKTYYFDFTDFPSVKNMLKSKLEFNVVNIAANAIEINFKTNSLDKGLDILDELTNVYANQNIEKKNHLADITIEYIDKQIDEISVSLNQTEQSLQNFKSTNQLLNQTEQASGISTQYRNLENQLAELITKKRYYEYVLDYLSKNDDFSNIIIPASLGIQDVILNDMVSELIKAQAQKSNLIENNQEKNPIVKKLAIQIQNLKKTISENISYALKTTEISIDELKKRIGKIEAEISRMPKTERQLTGLERKFRLTDAIYTYLMEKRSEANITRAANLPDNEVIEPASLIGDGPISPNKSLNYGIAFLLGLLIPFGYLQIKNVFNTKIETQEQIERISDVPVLGKILHNNYKTKNVVLEYPNSNIAESYRVLRTNLEYYMRGGHKKVIMVSSCIEGEGKSFNALNIAMSYAQLNRKTILLDFDLRKQTSYFNKQSENLIGLTSYLINKATLEDIIIKTPHDKLDYIASGPIPPNPVELIALEKTVKLINQLKDVYDYIIIDTPPLAQVTDAYLLIEQADIKVLVARYNYTIKTVFTHIIKDLRQKNIDNLCIVLNDNRFYRDQYGYGYGYNKQNK